MSDGWIKLHRKLNEWEWKTKPLTLALFVHLVLNANHKDKRWQGKIIKRGQIVTGRKQLAIDTGLSEQEVRTALNHLKTSGEATSQATNNYSIITINNYDLYQGEQPAKQPTANQPSNQRPTTNKNDNKYKNDKNNPPTPQGEDFELPDFIKTDVWEKWIKFRKEIKKPLKPTTAEQQIKKLTEWHTDGHDVNEIILTSVGNGWQGLFEPKKEKARKNERSTRDVLTDYIAEIEANSLHDESTVRCAGYLRQEAGATGNPDENDGL